MALHTDPGPRTDAGPDRAGHDGLARPLGVAAIVAGIALNPWTFIAISADGDIESRVILGAIIAFELVLIATGAWLIGARPRIRWSDLALTAVSLLFVLLLLEAGFRLGLAGGNDSTLAIGGPLGWAPKPFHERIRADHPVYGDLRYTSTRDGFRRFGEFETTKTKILFLGDSYTQAIQVSDGGTYYDRIDERRDDVEIFAFGAGGYGTLQEYMVLERWFDVIRPDLVVWQFTPNDIMNNTYALESRSAYNSRMPRPYLEDGRIVKRFPSRNPLIRHSLLGRFISVRLGYIGFENDDFRASSIENRVEERRDLWDQGVRTTVEILRRARARAGDVPIVAFEVQPSYLDQDLFPRIAGLAGIPFMHGVRTAVESAEADGVAVDYGPGDGHWNRRGHSIAGDAILEFLVDNGYLPKVSK